MHPLLKSEIENSDDKLNNFKHMKQQASLLSVMDQFHFLQNGSCFIEFGAGKGQLMYWIIRCAPEGEKKSFLLIDKSAQRHKSDNKFKDSDIQIERIRIDIQHLYLGKIQNIKNKLDKVVAVSKHLCGGATVSQRSNEMVDTLSEEALKLVVEPIFNGSLDLIIVGKSSSLQSSLDWTEDMAIGPGYKRDVREPPSEIAVTMFGTP
ncbi:unnamed protein product [Larinioides sclopetarius]